MVGLRGKSWRRFGASLTGLTLGLQLMLSSLGLIIAAAATAPAEGLYFWAVRYSPAFGLPDPSRDDPFWNGAGAAIIRS